MITQIGIVAGDIWQHLDKNGSVPLEKLVSELGASKDNVLMSLGWLAREGHITLTGADKGYEAALVKQTA